MHSHCLSVLCQKNPRMQTVASVVLLTFTWVLVAPTVLAAQTLPHPPPAKSPAPSAEAELAATLDTIAARLATLHQQLTTAEDARLTQQEIKTLRMRLAQLDTRVRENFATLAQPLKDTKVPAEILQRHQAMVATYETELAMLLSHLNALEAASDDRERVDKAAQAVEHLQRTKPRRPHKRVDPHNLPFRVPDGKVRPPKERKEEFESALVAPQPVIVASTALLPGLLAGALAGALAVPLPAPPTPDDLAPTEDVQLTAEIQALAASYGRRQMAVYWSQTSCRLHCLGRGREYRRSNA